MISVSGLRIVSRRIAAAFQYHAGERKPERASVITLKADAPKRVEIARSFSYKLNVGNYESRDFFCSEKSECSIEDAAEVSAALYAFCRSEVLKSVKEYLADMQKQRRGAA